MWKLPLLGRLLEGPRDEIKAKIKGTQSKDEQVFIADDPIHKINLQHSAE